MNNPKQAPSSLEDLLDTLLRYYEPVIISDATVARQEAQQAIETAILEIMPKKHKVQSANLKPFQTEIGAHAERAYDRGYNQAINELRTKLTVFCRGK